MRCSEYYTGIASPERAYYQFRKLMLHESVPYAIVRSDDYLAYEERRASITKREYATSKS